jgi:hypothetical protein
MASYFRSEGFQRHFVDRCLNDDERRQFLEDLEAHRRENRPLTLDTWYARRHRLTLAQAIVQLESRHSGRDLTTYCWMLEAIGEKPLPDSRPPEIVWNRSLGELRVDGRIARRVPSVEIAHRIVRILDAFRKQNWPERIESPFGEDLTPHELREIVRSLNRGLQGLRFRCDGTSRGITVGRS